MVWVILAVNGECVDNLYEQKSCILQSYWNLQLPWTIIQWDLNSWSIQLWTCTLVTMAITTSKHFNSHTKSCAAVSNGNHVPLERRRLGHEDVVFLEDRRNTIFTGKVIGPAMRMRTEVLRMMRRIPWKDEESASKELTENSSDSDSKQYWL